MIFEQEYKPVIEDFTKEGKVSLFAILKILENTGNRHSDAVGDSVFVGRENTQAWILTDWQLEISSYPSYTDKIKAQTWSQLLKSPVVATRDFILYKNDEVCVKGTTKWVLYDIATKHPCKIEQSLLNKYQPEDKAVFADQRLVKIAEPASFEVEKKIAIRRSDVDFNGHIHNLLYLDYALETIPFDVYEKHNFSHLRISYKSAVTSEKEIVCKYACVNGEEESSQQTHLVYMYDVAGQLKTIIQLR